MLACIDWVHICKQDQNWRGLYFMNMRFACTIGYHYRKFQKPELTRAHPKAAAICNITTHRWQALKGCYLSKMQVEEKRKDFLYLFKRKKANTSHCWYLVHYNCHNQPWSLFENPVSHYLSSWTINPFLSCL